MMESTKSDSEKILPNLQENALRDEREAVAATRPLKKEEEPPLKISPEAYGGPVEETLGEKILVGEHLSDVGETPKEPLRQSMDEDGGDSAPQRPDDKFRLEFVGSEMLRLKAPRAFEIADAVANDWIQDGRFADLPVGNPTVQILAQVGLRRAKDLEKKLDEKGVFLLARSGLEFLKSKLKK